MLSNQSSTGFRVGHWHVQTIYTLKEIGQEKIVNIKNITEEKKEKQENRCEQ